MFNRIKGTQDILDLSLFNFFIAKAKKHLEIYNFKEISTPILEPLDLYTRSLGTETDVVTKEMYTIKTDSEEEIICLRPEGTASIVRAFVNNNINETPWKVFSCGPMFRHERPQKGRYRQFNQLTMEIIGSNSINQDVNFIKMLDRFFSQVLSIDTYALLINFLGCENDRINFKSVLYKFLETISDKICSTCQVRKEKNIMRVFDCKNPTCQELYKDAPKIAQNLCASCENEWQDLKNNLEILSVSYSYSPNLVRGLDYYGKTVFEFVSTDLGAQNTFCGGGRYDQLAKEIGAKEDQPSIGAAIGIERIVLILEQIANKLVLDELPSLNLILPLGKEQQALGLLLADELQAHNVCTDILLEGDSVKSMMRKAGKLAAKYVILIGQEEQETKTVTVKNMIKGSQEKVAQVDLIKYLK